MSTVGECWRVNNAARCGLLNWGLIDTPPDIKDTAKAWVVHLLESNAPLTVANCFSEFKYFIAVAEPFECLHDLTYPALEGTLERMRTLGTARKFAVVRQWYRWCADQSLPGFREEVAAQWIRSNCRT